MTTRLRASTILAPDGRPVYIASNTGTAYEGAGGGRRWASLYAPDVSVQGALEPSQRTLVARARAIVRNHPRMFPALRKRVANIIGDGVRPRSRIVDKAQRDAVHSLWRESAEELDAGDRTTFYGLEALVTMAILVDGEIFYRFRGRRPEDGHAVPMQVELLEGDMVPLGRNERLQNGNVIRAGIEFDRLGRRVAFHVLREHPGEANVWAGLAATETVRVPADRMGHVFEVTRAGQVRGVSPMARMLLRAVDKDDYDDAQLLRQKIATLFAAFVSSPDGRLGPVAEVADGQTVAADDPVEWQTGSIVGLSPGEDVRFPDLPTLGSDYSAFQDEQNRSLAAGLEVSPWMFDGKLADVNFTSARVDLMDFRRVCRMVLAHTIVPQFCRPVWREWLRTAVMAAAIDLPGFDADPRAYLGADWIPPGFEWVDPLKEAQAKVENVGAGFMSRREVITERGRDPEQLE